MPFDMENAGETYMRAMTAIFHDMMHQEIEVYVDDVIIKSRTQEDHVWDLRKFFKRLCRYDLKLNPAKCAFRVLSGKLLGYIVSRRGIELDPTKIKSIQDLPPPRTKKEVMSLPGRLKYISRCRDLISPTGQHYTATAWLRFFYTNITAEYEACIMCMNMAADIDAKELLIMGDSNFIIRQPKVNGKLETLSLSHTGNMWKILTNGSSPSSSDTLASMLPYSGNVHIDLLEIQIQERHDYCNAIEIEPYGRPWYHYNKRFLKIKEYPEQANGDQKRTIRRLAIDFFLSGEVLYKRTPDMNLLRCVDAREAEKIMNEVHSGVCGPHMNEYVLSKKIVLACYYWMTMERITSVLSGSAISVRYTVT
nr:uncharacterized protein LOC117273316 [Nicotiana tomentosiformis]